MLHSSAWCPYSTKAKDMVKSKASVLFACLCTRTSNQDGLLRGQTVTKVTHYSQITKFPWTNSAMTRMCTAVPRVLYMNTDRNAKNTPSITVSMLFKTVCTLDLKSWGADVIKLWPNACITHREQSFPDTRVWNAQNVHNSVRCTLVSMKYAQSGSPYTTVLPFLHHISLAEWKPKTP